MAQKKTGTVSWATSEGWEVRATGAVQEGRRAAAEARDPFLENLTATHRWQIEQTLTATPKARRGEGVQPPLTLDVEGSPDDIYVVMTRYASGAVRFHMPSEPARRRARRGSRILYRFSIPVPAAPVPEAGGRRGFISSAIKTVVLKVAGKIADYALAKLALLWETATWKLKGRREGWLTVTPEGLSRKEALPAADFQTLSPTGRHLLFLHGTFSSTAAAFKGLAKTPGSNGKTLFEELTDVYGHRIYGFDHFTLSRTPEENVRMLLEALPDRPTTFDVVTHSRGGLVLRHLVERRDRFGSLADRFAVGRAVLVASPNGGTPLASPDHVTQYTNWLSNVMELFPENPFTTGVEFVSEALSWVARRLVGSLPGLASMDNNGEIIQALQATPGPPGEAYSALVANFEPNAALLQRIVDAGADLFFPTANDLVVPTEGGWRVDPGIGTAAIPGTRVGCFGLGGNLPQHQPVNHVNFFDDPGTVDFLVRALSGQAQPITPIDIAHDLPSGRRRGVARMESPSVTVAARTREEVPALRPSLPPQRVSAPTASLPPAPEPDEVFHIALIAPKQGADVAQLIATFRNARVMEQLHTGDERKAARSTSRGANDRAPTQWDRIKAGQAHIQGYIDGDPAYPQLPNEAELQRMGSALFGALFPGQVRRLYDAARSEQVSQRLNLIFTSDIGWIADQSWEFIYDPDRRTFLALEEVNFTRNVLTAIPAERIPARPTLRILVVVAQPLGLGTLSVEEEADVIRSGFRRLLDAGLAEVELLLDATPELLHRTLESATAPIDVLHFIGHGEYEEQSDCGYLIFENQDGGEQRLDSSTLRQIVCRRGIRLVCLNACETGRGGHQDFSRGVAQALIAGGVPAVVANQYPVLDVSATAFSRHFYWALAMGQSIGDAAREARVSVNYSISGEAIDWAVPVVFARNPAQHLCLPRTAADYERTRSAAVRSRRRAVGDRIRIGIWNAHRMIPHLPDICEHLTQVQTRYAFETVSFPAPIGTWRREQEKDQAFVVAETLYDRLKTKPQELAVDQLICMINFPMKDARTSYLYYWRRDPLIVTSTFELLEQLNEREFTVERMMAHLAAAVVAGIPPHPRKVGPADCPLFYNEKRDIRSIAGRLTFCARCRKQCTDKEALARLHVAEQILAAYP
ncbi:MAG: CHAT domain-containing protein [Nitrospira sp. CR1.2]|nr:CHAT domain-containing protein [Nitrospira sp. CR1.2]